MIRAFSHSGITAGGGGGIRPCLPVPFASSTAHPLRHVTVVCSSLSNSASVRPLHVLRGRQYCSDTARAIQRKNSCISRCSRSSFGSQRLRNHMILNHRQQTQSQQRRFQAGGTGHTGGKGKLSRKERRALKHQDRSSTESRNGRNTILQSSSAQNNRQSGSSTSRRTLPLPDRNRIKSISLRVPPLLLLLYGTMLSSGHPQYGYDYGISPGGVSMGLGASMIPTILPHDVVLWECISYRFLPDVLKRELQVGDVVIYVVDKDKGFFGARYITKRIVATGGVEVDRRGQNADLYGGQMNYGILPDSNDTQEMVEDDEYATRYGRQIDTVFGEKEGKVTVPEGHLWLEGDNPLYSIDSRHYGPIPITHVRGRVVARLFPWYRTSGGAEGKQKDNDGRRSPGFGFFGLNRPEPPSLEDLTSGKHGCFRVPPAAGGGA